MIRAKLSVFSVIPGRCMIWPNGGPGIESDCETIRFCAVSGGPGTVNKEWNQNTPRCDVEIVIANPAAMGRFQMGKSYYLDFTLTGD